MMQQQEPTKKKTIVAAKEGGGGRGGGTRGRRPDARGGCWCVGIESLVGLGYHTEYENIVGRGGLEGTGRGREAHTRRHSDKREKLHKKHEKL